MFYIVLGYCIAVLFPMPYINGFIVNAWKTLASKIEDWIKGSALPTPSYPTMTPTPPSTEHK